MSGHTPGPWRWSNTANTDVRLLSDGNDGVFMVMDFVRRGMTSAQPRLNDGGYGMLKTEKMNLNEHPDARLIAAAPDLLFAVKSLIAAASGSPKLCGHECATCVCASDAARDAIAKAEGAK